jgi:hypothetical protein
MPSGFGRSDGGCAGRSPCGPLGCRRAASPRVERALPAATVRGTPRARNPAGFGRSRAIAARATPAPALAVAVLSMVRIRPRHRPSVRAWGASRVAAGQATAAARPWGPVATRRAVTTVPGPERRAGAVRPGGTVSARCRPSTVLAGAGVSTRNPGYRHRRSGDSHAPPRYAPSTALRPDQTGSAPGRDGRPARPVSRSPQFRPPLTRVPPTDPRPARARAFPSPTTKGETAPSRAPGDASRAQAHAVTTRHGGRPNRRRQVRPAGSRPPTCGAANRPPGAAGQPDRPY